MDLFNKKLTNFKIPNSSDYSYEELRDGEYNISTPNGNILFIPDFIEKKISDRTVEYLIENDRNLNFDDKIWRDIEKDKLASARFKNIEWRHDKIKMFGKETYIPRFSAWYGNDGMSYTYSGLKLNPKPWNEGLLYLKNRIELIIENKFNSVLLNWYRDGNDHIGWHSDDEKSLGTNPVIASLNFGTSRKFKLKNRNKEIKEELEFILSHGSLIIMKEGIQKFYLHSVPKESKVNKGRINLTFRLIN